MEIPDIVIFYAILVAIILVGILLFTRKTKIKTPEEKLDKLLADVAFVMAAQINEEEIEFESNGLKMRYGFKVSKNEETSTLHHSFSVETNIEMEKFYVILPTFEKQAVVYPKTEFSAYIPSQVRKLFENDKDAANLASKDYAIAASLGGNCISPKLGLYVGKRGLIMLEVFGELNKENVFYSLFSSRLKEDEKSKFREDWKKLLLCGFNLLEKIVEIERSALPASENERKQFIIKKVS